MFVKLACAAPLGLSCAGVEVEVDINKGQTSLNIVGLTDTSIQEAKDRIHSAIKNSGYNYPFNFRILINLAPANLHKEGPLYDLAMASGIILAQEKNIPDLSNILLLGELALDGSLRRVQGVLPIVLYAKENGIENIIVPKENLSEAALIKDINIFPANNLAEVINHLLKKNFLKTFSQFSSTTPAPIGDLFDMSQIKGQEFAKRALEVAAAGGHNVLFSGPPGSGKTLLAKTLPTILPPLTDVERLEVTKIYSIAGLLSHGLINHRPFRSPHHTISHVALVGGGKLPRPGEISLAHRGVLFLDEFPEFNRESIEALRQPLEDGSITVARAQRTLKFPARFILAASLNPCPCGYAGDPQKTCACSAAILNKYQKKISGPILDRIDLHIEVPRLNFEKLTADQKSETSAQIRRRVIVARDIQQNRFKNSNIISNAEMGNNEIKKFCQLDQAGLILLRTAVEKMHLSARSYYRLLKIARTIADLGNQENVDSGHIAEALQFRTKSYN
jgi:magnesium chelatase family protein